MPNTIDYRVLRRRFHAVHGRNCVLNTAEINKLWSATRRNRNTGAGVPRDVLEARAAETLDLMLMAEPAGTIR